KGYTFFNMESMEKSAHAACFAITGVTAGTAVTDICCRFLLSLHHLEIPLDELKFCARRGFFEVIQDGLIREGLCIHRKGTFLINIVYPRYHSVCCHLPFRT